MKLRVLAVTVALALVSTLGGLVAAPAHADDTSDLIASQLSDNSKFLWQSPGTRYIVVLGAKVGPYGEIPEILNERLDVAAKLGKGHPFNRIIASGGDTWWLPVSEAQFMNIGLIQRGIPTWQMVNESESTSTVQNAEFTVRMLKNMGATGAVIVTNGFHMDRAIGNFRDAAKEQKATLEFRRAYAS